MLHLQHAEAAELLDVYKGVAWWEMGPEVGILRGSGGPVPQGDGGWDERGSHAGPGASPSVLRSISLHSTP